MTPTAKRLADFPDLERKAPRVVVNNGTSKLAIPLDQKGIKGYAVGFQGLVRLIMAQLPQNEVIEVAVRKEAKLVPEAVIRELVANALIHQNITMTAISVIVEIYSNRFEILNPGDPVLDPLVPSVLIKPLHNGTNDSKWLLADRCLLDLGDWELRMLYSMHG